MLRLGTRIVSARVPALCVVARPAVRTLSYDLVRKAVKAGSIGPSAARAAQIAARYPGKEVREVTPFPPPAKRSVDNLPFRVRRTDSNQLPVYSSFPLKSGKKMTVVRRIRGNKTALAEQLQLLLGPKHKVVAKPTRIEINGLHTARIKLYLANLGF
jgi:hypothetical protein